MSASQSGGESYHKPTCPQVCHKDLSLEPPETGNPEYRQNLKHRRTKMTSGQLMDKNNLSKLVSSYKIVCEVYAFGIKGSMKGKCSSVGHPAHF